MATKATEFGDASGYSSSKGYEYQILVGIYYLVVDGAREIEYEADGEDLSIINENPDRLSIEYIQAKYLDCGSFTLANYASGVFPQFWKAFESALERHSEKEICCTLTTNVSWDKNLRNFIESCKKTRRGLTLEEVQSGLTSTAVKSYQRMRKGKKVDRFQRFLFGLDVNYSWTGEMLQDSIISHMQKCNIFEPHGKLAIIKSHILEVGQGIITRRKIEELIGHTLDPIERASKKVYTERDINKSLEFISEKKAKYEVGDEYPDSEKICRDMTFGLRNAGETIKQGIAAKSGMSINSKDYQESIDADIEKANEDAELVASLEVELWTSKKRFTQRLTSIEKAANAFDYII